MDSYIPKQEELPPPSYIRFIHVSPGCRMIDVYFDSRMAAKKFGYKKYTPYFPIIPGQHTIDVFRAGKNDKPAAILDINLKQDLIYTVVIEGSQANRILLVHDPWPECGNNMSNIRFINTALETPILEITSSDNPTSYSHLSYRSIPEYTALPSGKHTFQAKKSGVIKPDLVIPDIELKPEWNYTVYITGGSPGTSSIHWITLIDGSTYIKRREQTAPQDALS